jgi:hypothetical protein
VSSAAPDPVRLAATARRAASAIGGRLLPFTAGAVVRHLELGPAAASIPAADGSVA